MNQIIVGKIDYNKIDQDLLYHGKTCTYLDFKFIERADDYGNDGMVIQSVSKEAAQRGERGPIIGNYKVLQLKDRRERDRRDDRRRNRDDRREYRPSDRREDRDPY
jgi:hypothetical protein